MSNSIPLESAWNWITSSTSLLHRWWAILKIKLAPVQSRVNSCPCRLPGKLYDLINCSVGSVCYPWACTARLPKCNVYGPIILFFCAENCILYPAAAGHSWPNKVGSGVFKTQWRHPVPPQKRSPYSLAWSTWMLVGTAASIWLLLPFQCMWAGWRG